MIRNLTNNIREILVAVKGRGIIKNNKSAVGSTALLLFVTDDGAETDLDLGHYERFINENFVVSFSFMSILYHSLVTKLCRSSE